MLKFLKKRENHNKMHLDELNKARCQRYYHRHKRELKESKKYGSLGAYRRAQKQHIEKITQQQEPKKQEVPSQV